MVEKSFNSTFTEVLYNPLGKAATMSGQTLNLAHMPLPGGATIAENSGNRNFYHKDWLGSVRFASGMGSRTAGIDRAFAPFGETYDGVINGSNDPNFTGDTQDSIAGLYDTPNRELHPNQGRWISPDPAGLGAVDPTNRRVGTDTRMC
jgi:RHS repeat-associated protein